jgi:hypothetical protein
MIDVNLSVKVQLMTWKGTLFLFSVFITFSVGIKKNSKIVAVMYCQLIVLTVPEVKTVY